MKKLICILVCLMLLPVSAYAQVKVNVSGGTKLEGEAIKIKIPFNEEYRINLNNTDTNRRALVKIRIDGRNVTRDGLILRAGEMVSLERFLDVGTFTKGKKFKFVPKDDESLRPDNAEDGQIVVTVQYEKSKEPVVKYEEESQPFYGWNDRWREYQTFNYTLTSNVSATIDTPGITVEGNESTQRFQKDEVDEMEDQIDTLVIQLVGYWKKQPILVR